MAFTRISIVGVGLLGGSIALAIKARHPFAHIVGFDLHSSALDQAIEIGAIDQRADSFKQAADAGLIILASPVSTFRLALGELAPHVAAGVIVTDVGSTKRSVVRDAEQMLPAGAYFVGSHPMAGSEKCGVEFARADLLDQALCLITPTSNTDAGALAQVGEFWRDLGMSIAQLSPDVHDRLLADISHLPHALAAALVAMQSPESLKIAGKGFLDTTRIAGGDGQLWRDIFKDNRDNLADSLHRFRESLDRLMKMLADNDDDAVAQWLNQAAQSRESVLKTKLREMNPD